MKTDYPELEGTKIRFTGYNSIGKPMRCDAIVAGVNYHVGITIVMASDKKVNLVCLNRKEHTKGEWSPALYRVLFFCILKQIKEGRFNYDYTKEVETIFRGESMRTGPSYQCAFNS